MKKKFLTVVFCASLLLTIADGGYIAWDAYTSHKDETHCRSAIKAYTFYKSHSTKEDIPTIHEACRK